MKYRSVVCLSVLAVMLVAAPAAMAEPGHEAGETTDATAARARALRDVWPDTAVGMVASRWVEAYAAGEDAMSGFYEDNLTDSSLAKRPMKERISSYVKLRNRLGDLMLSSVAKSSPDELTAVLLAEDASKHKFVFTVAKDPPHTLAMVGMLQGHGHGRHSSEER